MKLCCIPVRPLLYTLAILGIIPSCAQIYWTSNVTREIVPITYILCNVFLMYSVYKKNEMFLRWSQKLIIAIIIASLFPILVFPVVGAAYVASGKMHFTNSTESRFFERHTSSSRFFNGAMFGLFLEVFTFLTVGVEILKYVVISRIWRLETEDRFVNADAFKTV